MVMITPDFLFCAIPFAEVLAPCTADSATIVLTPYPTLTTPSASIALLPTIGFLPETRIIGGLVVQALLRQTSPLTTVTKSLIEPRGKFSPSIIGTMNALSDEQEPDILYRPRPSRIVFNALYTQNKQTIVSFEPDLWLHNDSLHLYGFAEYTDFPDKFWGLGTRADDRQEESFSGQYYTLQASAEWLIAPHTYSGVRYEFQRTFILADPGTLLADGTVPGSLPTTVSGITLFTTYDTRDNLFATEQGVFLQASVSGFGTIVGSDVNFFRANGDARYFITPYKGGTLGVQGIFSTASVGTPFRQMGLLGGQRFMRGIRRGRYVDNTLAGAQVEWRQHIIWRVGMVAFAGIGTVAPSLSTIEIQELKFAGGVGLRFALFPDDRLNVRFDLGWSKHGSGFYINISEAF